MTSCEADEPALELETDKATVEIPATATGGCRSWNRRAPPCGSARWWRGSMEDTAAPAPSTRPAPTADPAPEGVRGHSRCPDAVRRPPPRGRAQRAPESPQTSHPIADPRHRQGRLGQPAVDVLRHGRKSRPGASTAPPATSRKQPRDEQSGRDEQEAPRAIEAEQRRRRARASPAARRARRASRRTERVPPIAVPRRGSGTRRRDRRGRAEPMSRLRRRIAERLVEAQRTAAILTTFNEVDLSRLLAARKRHRERFRERHGVDLGLDVAVRPRLPARPAPSADPQRADRRRRHRVSPATCTSASPSARRRGWSSRWCVTPTG